MHRALGLPANYFFVVCMNSASQDLDKRLFRFFQTSAAESQADSAMQQGSSRVSLAVEALYSQSGLVSTSEPLCSSRVKDVHVMTW